MERWGKIGWEYERKRIRHERRRSNRLKIANPKESLEVGFRIERVVLQTFRWRNV
jgi:hypothetical protein